MPHATTHSGQAQTAPRHFLHGGMLPGAGLPHDRMARMAARRAFVLLKQVFLDALAAVDDQRGHWLRQQVRLAEEPVALWLLRAPVYAALRGPEVQHQQHRRRLRRSLDALFPDAHSDSAAASLFGGLAG